MRTTRLVLLAASLAAVSLAFGADPSATPTTRPAAVIDPRTWKDATSDDLLASAKQAEQEGQLELALAMYRDLAVRVRNDPDRVSSALAKVREIEARLGPAAAPVIEGINAPRVPHEPPRTDVIRDLTLEKLGNFAYEVGNPASIPDDVKALDGTTVCLSGFMFSPDQAEKITEFVLVPDLFGCCFGQPPQIQHTAVIKAPAGKSVVYFADPILVTGKLTVREVSEEGFVITLFTVEATSIKPAE